MKWVLIAWYALTAALTVAAIGRPRGPVTRAEATVGVTICTVLAVLVAVMW